MIIIDDDGVMHKVLPMDTLNKIRAEIKGLTYYWCEINPNSVIDDVLQIVDKYITERSNE